MVDSFIYRQKSQEITTLNKNSNSKTGKPCNMNTKHVRYFPASLCTYTKKRGNIQQILSFIACLAFISQGFENRQPKLQFQDGDCTFLVHNWVCHFYVLFNNFGKQKPKNLVDLKEVNKVLGDRTDRRPSFEAEKSVIIGRLGNKVLQITAKMTAQFLITGNTEILKKEEMLH